MSPLPGSQAYEASWPQSQFFTGRNPSMMPGQGYVAHGFPVAQFGHGFRQQTSTPPHNMAPQVSNATRREGNSQVPRQEGGILPAIHSVARQGSYDTGLSASHSGLPSDPAFYSSLHGESFGMDGARPERATSGRSKLHISVSPERICDGLRSSPPVAQSHDDSSPHADCWERHHAVKVEQQYENQASSLSLDTAGEVKCNPSYVDEVETKATISAVETQYPDPDDNLDYHY